MSETKAQSASDISREAKGLNQGLQEILKSKDPWEREVEFQRKNLRRQYVRLLLIYPYAKESKDAETRLWLQSSYAFITIYKHRIARADPSGPSGGPRQGRREPQGGVVEYRKLLSRFRQFLAEEEKFWTQLVVRLHRSFGLDEAHASLVALELIPPDVIDAVPVQQQADTGGRGLNMFPPEEESVLPSNPEQRQAQLSIVGKALICLGDIARYREQYNEKGGRPKAGQEIGPPAKKNVKKQNGDFIIRSRDYERAQQRYEQARILVPSEGNASHQMAILASYQRDTFGSLVHYYRALCVQQPYETAAENMDRALNKALDYWKSSESNKTARQQPTTPRLRIEDLKERIVVLHAYWASGNEDYDDLPVSIVEIFRSLVSERLLPSEIISKVIVLTQGVMWKHRMLRSSSKKSSNTIVEAQIATQLLAIHRALLEVGAEELGEAPPDDSEDLAQSITATFRRTLPALRMASKWIRANFKYFVSDGTRVTSINGVSEYWDVFARFSTALERRFPLESLPHLTTALEEDLDARGFLPLARLMTTGPTVGHTTGDDDRPISREQVHPNEEQLMRLWDLSTDAKAIAESQGSPIKFYSNQYVVKGKERVHRIDEKTKDVPDMHHDREASRTDDDPISEAFRTVLGENGDVDDDEDDLDAEGEDEIVWDLRAPISPTHKLTESDLSPPPRLSPTSSSPRVPISLVPTHVQIKPSSSPALKPIGTTAQDLLNNVMGLSASQSESTANSPLLFGSTGLHGSSHSIWSTSLDDSTYPGVNNHHQRSRSQYAPPGSPFLFSHSPLASPSRQLNQQYQPQAVGQPMSPLAPQLHPIGHQRTQSTSLPSPLVTPHSPHQHVELSGGNTYQPPLAFSKASSLSDPAIAALGASPNFPMSVSRHAFTSSPASPHSLVSQHLWGNVG